jgi:putative hydrolase of the HAD superfamily
MRHVLMVDVDGVLVNGRPKDGLHFATNLEADLGIPLEKLQAEFFKPHWEAIVTGRVAMLDRLVPVLARLAPTLAVERFVSYWFENDARIDEDIRDTLREYRAAGRRVFLATNQEHLRARYLMETLGLAAEVDGMLYSAALGDRKPGAAFFRLAAARAGVKPADIAFVDDAEVNVEGARKAGWEAVLWRPGDDFNALVGPLIGHT